VNLFLEGSKQEPPAEKELYKCYTLYGILYLPHYTQSGVYVSPMRTSHGHHKFYLEGELKRMGASPRKEYLFKTLARDESAK
jgi:hypothetical protein